jgi:predicted transcriptional regulator
MARTRQLPEFIQELIRWRWSQKPTLKSLADEYGVSQSCISDILNPKLRLRRRRKYHDDKRPEQEVAIEAIPVCSYSARKVSRRKG